MSALFEPWRRSLVLAGALVAAGFAGIALAWYGVSDTLVVPTQVAYAVSGGIGGFALAGSGLALLEIQRRRYAAAQERRDFASFARDLAAVAEAIADRRAREVARSERDEGAAPVRRTRSRRTPLTAG